MPERRIEERRDHEPWRIDMEGQVRSIRLEMERNTELTLQTRKEVNEARVEIRGAHECLDLMREELAAHRLTSASKEDLANLRDELAVLITATRVGRWAKAKTLWFALGLNKFARWIGPIIVATAAFISVYNYLK